MLRRDRKKVQFSCDGDAEEYDGYFTYRPLSNLPTPPPSLNSSAAQSPRNPLEDGHRIKPKFLGKSYHFLRLTILFFLASFVPACVGFGCPRDTCMSRASAKRTRVDGANCGTTRDHLPNNLLTSHRPCDSPREPHPLGRLPRDPLDPPRTDGPHPREPPHRDHRASRLRSRRSRL